MPGAIIVAVRYADGPTVEVETVIEASVERVWDLVSDVGVPARFSEELQAAEWLDPSTAPGIGSRFRGRSRHPAAGEWETLCVVTEWEPEHRFGWAVGDPAFPSASWRFDMASEGRGARLSQWARIGPAPSGLTPAIEAMPDKEERIVARRLEEHRANMSATLAGIKALAEAQER
jgi:Polyketide cyclase / dehydrase and lipid transport